LKHKLTDNSFLGDKIALRVNNVPKKESLRVLDCYHGSGTIWKNVQERYTGKITVVKIDKFQKDDLFVLLGDNLKYLKKIDLSVFDAIDLDAYGIPFEQLKLLFERKYRGVVFVTFIQTLFGKLPVSFLESLGYTQSMVAKCPTLFYKNGLEKLCSFLEQNGVKKIICRTFERKNYLCFSIG
jgi:hypothetical protein